MTETEWLTSTEPDVLLGNAYRSTCPRRYHLLACACCRRIWDLLADEPGRRAVTLAERFADGLATCDDLDECRSAFPGWDIYNRPHKTLAPTGFANQAAWLTTNYSAMLAYEMSYLLQNARAARYGWGLRTDRAQADLMRDIYGNPYRPVAFDPRWRSETVRLLAAAIYEERAFDRLPILADALEEAGCDNAAILAHCRGPGPHVRGCWVVDLVLGNE